MNERARYVLRIVAGLYLAYLGITMVRGLMEDRPENMLFILIIAVFFVIIGAFFIIISVKSVMALRNEDTPQEENSEDYSEDTVDSENNTLEIAEDNEDELEEEKHEEEQHDEDNAAKE